MRTQFSSFSKVVAKKMGSAYAFTAAAAVILVWLVTGLSSIILIHGS